MTLFLQIPRCISTTWDVNIWTSFQLKIKLKQNEGPWSPHPHTKEPSSLCLSVLLLFLPLLTPTSSTLQTFYQTVYSLSFRSTVTATEYRTIFYTGNIQSSCIACKKQYLRMELMWMLILVLTTQSAVSCPSPLPVT